VLETWGFLVPFVWGFSAKWLPIFLGLRPIRERVLLGAAAQNWAGVVAAAGGRLGSAVAFLVSGIMLAVWALRLLEPAERPAKIRGVHSSFPFVLRLSYAWAAAAGALSTWAVVSVNSYGIWGASRHALTAGFLSTMVFCVGQRVLPAFSGTRLLFSRGLLFL
jgi:hypothetical protein